MHPFSPPVRFFLCSALIISSPLVAFAQSATDVPSLFGFVLSIINNYIVPVIFAVAFVVFILGIYRFFIYNGGDSEKVAEGRKFVVWSILGFILMFSIWGLINIFMNTLGFSSSTRPAFPTFGSVTNTTGTVNANNGIFPAAGSGTAGSTGSGNIFSGLFGGGTSAPATLTPGQTITSNGVTYTATGANTVAPVNGSCLAGYVLSGSQCVSSGTNTTGSGNFFSSLFGGTAGSGTGNGSGPSDISGIPNGSSCTISSSNPDGNCEGALICSNGTCKPDPQAENGDGTLNSTCVPPGDCDGNMVCDVNSQTCQNPGTAGVSDVGSWAGAPADGSVAQGGSCAGNENACASGTCNIGVCADENSGNSTTGGVQQCDYGSIRDPGQCILCSDGSTTANDVANCPSGAGYSGSQEDTGSGASDGSSVDNTDSTDNSGN